MVISSSPNKTGEVSGFAVFEMEENQTVKLTLQNITDYPIYLSPRTPVQASLMIFLHDALPAFGYFYTPYRASRWAIESGNFFVFYENGPSRNISHDPVTSEIMVLESGQYEINYIFAFAEPADIVITLLVNNVPAQSIPLSNFTGVLNDTLVLPLTAGSVLKWQFEFLE